MLSELRLLSIAYGLLITAMVSWTVGGGGRALAVLTLSFACAVYAGVLHAREGVDAKEKRMETWPLACLVLLAIGLSWHAIFLNNPGSILTAQNILSLRHALFVLIILAYATPLSRWSGGRSCVFASILTLSVLQLMLTPGVSPRPIIDVHGMSQWAAGALLDGKNPYVEDMPNMYGPDYEAMFGAVDHYVYTPATLYLQTAAYAVLGEIRYASIAGILIFSVCLWLLSAGWKDERHRELLVLAFIANPLGVFIVEQSWTEPLLLAVLGIAVVLKARGKSTWAFAAFGYALAMKQYIAFLVPAMFMMEKKRRTLVIAGVVAAATLLPFVFHEPIAMVQNGILFQMKSGPLRYDSFNFAPRLAGIIGSGTKQLTALVGLASAAWTAWMFRRQGLSGFLYSSVIIIFASFLFGGVAFINYYYGVAGLILLTLAVRAKPERSAL